MTLSARIDWIEIKKKFGENCSVLNRKKKKTKEQHQAYVWEDITLAKILINCLQQPLGNKMEVMCVKCSNRGLGYALREIYHWEHKEGIKLAKWRNLYFQELVKPESDKNCSAVTAPLLGLEEHRGLFQPFFYSLAEEKTFWILTSVSFNVLENTWENTPIFGNILHNNQLSYSKMDLNHGFTRSLWCERTLIFHTNNFAQVNLKLS